MPVPDPAHNSDPVSVEAYLRSLSATADVDQANAAAESFARYIAAYYRTLRAGRVPPQAAQELSLAYQDYLLHHAAGGACSDG